MGYLASNTNYQCSDSDHVRHFGFACDFITSSRKCTELGQLSKLFQEAINSIGFDMFACVSHVNLAAPPDDAITILQYPQSWQDRYFEKQYEKHDRIRCISQKQAIPFQWDAPVVTKGMTKLQQKIFNEASELDVRYGLTIPIHAPGTYPGSISLAGPHKDIDPNIMHALHLMSVYLHDRALKIMAKTDPQWNCERRILTERERECLSWVANGKTDWEIGEILGISENTVHRHVENAKRRFQVVTRTQAAIKAVMDNQIRP